MIRLFGRRPKKERAPDGLPHLRGRFEFERFFGGLAERRRNWQAAALLGLAANLVLAIGFVRLALQHRVVPYVVEVDALGETRSVGKLATAAIPERAIEVALRRFVHNLRTVPTDSRLFNARLKEAQAYAAAKALESFLGAVGDRRAELEEMLRRGDSRYVDEISAVLRVPGKDRVYRVTWRESARRGAAVAETGYEGYFRLELSNPKTEEEMLANPFGIFVTDYTVTRVAGK